MPTLRSLALLTLVTGLACTHEQERALPKTAEIDRSPLLTEFTGCAELEQTIEDALVLRMRSMLEQSRVGIYAALAGPGAEGTPAAAAEGPSAYTTTNSQVEGVAEADFVQNDGTRIAALAGGMLHLARSWPAEALARTASVAIEGWPHDLFLAGDRAVVFSSVYVPRTLEGEHLACPATIAPGGDATCGYWAHDVVKITTLDVSDLAAPVVTSEVYLPGSYVSARRIGDRVRLVTSDTLPFPDGVLFWPAVPPGADEAERKAAFEALAAKNEGLIRARTLDDWLRRGTLKREGVADLDLGYTCTEFAHGSGPVRPGILTIATFDVGSASLVSRTSVFAEPGMVYASQQTLYLASQHWWWWPEPGQRDATYLHAFDLTDPDRARYLGSGVVDGDIRDQYAMDELDGALRVVTTTVERVDDGTPWGRVQTAARISVLKQGGGLELVGETPAFGANEQVFGTRFVGTRGFVITARQIDPLFTFDLSDAANPALVGELEMPGFISYLHPIDDTHLLGVGMERATAAAPNQVKVALLDVADLAHPVDVSTVLVGAGWSWSEALWDPKAFTWLGAQKLLAIPFADYGGTTPFVSDLRLFRVDAATGITPAGSLSLADVYLKESGPGWSWSWSPYVRRSILADEFVYAVSDAGIRSAKVADLPAWLATIEFPPLVHP